MTKYIDKVYLISDGGCRGNPGQGAIGFIIRDEKDGVIAKGGECIDHMFLWTISLFQWQSVHFFAVDCAVFCVILFLQKSAS